MLHFLVWQASNLRVELARLIEVIGEEAQDGEFLLTCFFFGRWSDGWLWWWLQKSHGILTHVFFHVDFFKDLFFWEGEVMDDLVVLCFLSCEAHLQTCETSRTATSKPAKNLSGGKSTTGQLGRTKGQAPKTTTPSYSVCFFLIFLLSTTKKIPEKKIKHHFGMFFLDVFFFPTTFKPSKSMQEGFWSGGQGAGISAKQTKIFRWVVLPRS